jgi:hypothetical protein
MKVKRDKLLYFFDIFDKISFMSRRKVDPKVSEKHVRGILKSLEEKPLSNTDIKKCMGKDCKLIVYNDLENCNNIRKMLGKDKSLIILIETKPYWGHWICVFERNRDTLEHFDSLGYPVDGELSFVPNEMKKGPLLSNAISGAGYKKVIYNLERLQKDGKANTCGKWVVNRLKMRDRTLPEFIKLFKSEKGKIETDMLCCITYYIYSNGLE